MGLLLLICKVVKDIIWIKKQFSLATLTLKILQDQLFNPLLGADHILKHNGSGSHRESCLEHGKRNLKLCGLAACVLPGDSVCWDPAHLGFLLIAAGVFLSSWGDSFNFCRSALSTCWSICRVPGAKFQNASVKEDPFPSSHSTSPQLPTPNPGPCLMCPFDSAWYQATSEFLRPCNPAYKLHFASRTECSPPVTSGHLLYLFLTICVGKRL